MAASPRPEAAAACSVRHQGLCLRVGLQPGLLLLLLQQGDSGPRLRRDRAGASEAYRVGDEVAGAAQGVARPRAVRAEEHAGGRGRERPGLDQAEAEGHEAGGPGPRTRGTPVHLDLQASNRHVSTNSDGASMPIDVQ